MMTAKAIVPTALVVLVWFFGSSGCGTERDFGDGSGLAGAAPMQGGGAGRGGSSGSPSSVTTSGGAGGALVGGATSGGNGAGGSGMGGDGRGGTKAEAGATAEGTCSLGALQCAGLQPQQCDSTGAWLDLGEPCQFVCAKGACVGTCTPGAAQCNELQPEVCDASGEWQSEGEPCDTVCNAGTCESCMADTMQCNGLQPQECEDGLWLNVGTACDFVCEPSTGQCAGTCTPGSKQCDDLQPQLCGPDGTWQDEGTVCPMVCSAGSCAACLPDATSCNGLQPQVCSAGGVWQPMGTPCPFVCNSSTGACTGVCTPGAKQCDELQPQVCNASGAWQNVGDPCRFVCSGSSGTCVGSCVPEAKQCGAGSQPQVCDANGAWASVGAACGGCSPCSATTGTCVANTGADCDINKCINGEKCQSNGMCGGGTPVTCPTPGQCETIGACVPASGCPAPVPRTGSSCNDDNPCTTGDSCQGSTCSGGSQRPLFFSCGNSRYCDGNGGCNCRTPSLENRRLTNPGFNGSSSWMLRGGATYVTTDVDGCAQSGGSPGSGSIRLSGTNHHFGQCVSVEPDTEYHLAFRYKSSYAPAGPGEGAWCWVHFFPAGTACAFDTGSGPSVIMGYETTNWLQGHGTVNSPTDAERALIWCQFASIEEGASILYDQFYFGTLNPGTPSF